MRPVLLGGRQRQHRNPSLARSAREVRPADVGPVARRSDRSHRANFSIGRFARWICIGYESAVGFQPLYHGPKRPTESNMNPALLPRALTALLLAFVMAVSPGRAQTRLDKVSFGTNWVAEAEHGGFFQ